MGIFSTVFCRHVMPFLLEKVTKNLKIDRSEILSHLSGHVLEVGIGTGANLPFYPASVDKVTGIDLEAPLLKRCQRNWTNLGPQKMQLELSLGNAEELPFPSHSFDAILSCLVFCSISSAEKAAEELFRLLKPGGQLIFFEHILDWDERTAKWQRRLNPIWGSLSCGCQLTSKTDEIFRKAGFQFQVLDKYYHRSLGKFFSSVIKGIAIKNVGAEE